MLTAVLKNKSIVSFTTIFGTLSFPILRRLQAGGGDESDADAGQGRRRRDAVVQCQRLPSAGRLLVT